MAASPGPSRQTLAGECLSAALARRSARKRLINVYSSINSSRGALQRGDERPALMGGQLSVEIEMEVEMEIEREMDTELRVEIERRSFASPNNFCPTSAQLMPNFWPTLATFRALRRRKTN